MEKNSKIYQAYVNILKEELLPAMGCTEPIALAYAGAYARKILGALPDKVVIDVSGSIIKNVKSVIVPNTGDMRGLDIAAAAGIVAGNPDKKLEVIAVVSPSQIEKIKDFAKNVPITINHVENGFMFDMMVTLFKGESYAKVRIVNNHTNIVLVEKDGNKLVNKGTSLDKSKFTDRSVLNMHDIWDFINTLDVEDVKPILEPQIKYNMAIAERGIHDNFGANVGKTILAAFGNSVENRARAMAAAGSDARMNGCEEPVIINSGSGNQGITVSVPIVVYAKELKVSEDKLYRALALGNLTSIHEKTPIGVLSAYCGAVSAGAGAGAGIAYLCGGGYEGVVTTVSNALAVVSGMICDGAGSSCAGKIAASVEAGIIGYKMYGKGQAYKGHDGILGGDIEETIANVGRLAKEGMETTNNKILEIMVG
ncbi:MAG: L-serine ammonia-lyase, iron-sulfur-dependent, subunit alpha [Acidaminococcaceae bacterium]|jgi:L-cysteine desulfidase|nr:L-serine ammonia-lyase, iron-sulfur-dependent, subunit alpha [Acidaminococcaceae bacterium]